MKRIILAIIMVAFILVPVGNAEAKPLLENKPCGDTATYTLDEDGTLTIKGNGKVDINENSYEEIFALVKKLVVTEGITKVTDWRGLEAARCAETISLPESMTDLGIMGLYNLQNIKTIAIPSKVTELKYQVFGNCSKLANITWPKNLKKIGEEAFLNCKSLKKLQIPDSVTYIGKNAFKGCSELQSLTIPKNLKTFKTSLMKMPKLLKVVNHSKKKFSLDFCDGGKTWRVNGKKVKSVGPGKTAVCNLPKYKVKYNFCGGKPTGKCPKSYCYGKAPKLPDVKRKGYIFFGWYDFNDCKYLNEGFPTKEQKNITMTAVFVKVKINRISNDKIKATLKDSIPWKKLAKNKSDLEWGYTYPKYKIQEFCVDVVKRCPEGKMEVVDEFTTTGNKTGTCSISPKAECYVRVGFNWSYTNPWGDNEQDEDYEPVYYGNRKFRIPAYKK